MSSGQNPPDSDAQALGASAMQRLRDRDVCSIEAGLTDAELDRTESQFGFRFSDDHRAFLAAGLPTNARPRVSAPGVIAAHAHPWPDWRNGDPDDLRRRLQWPREGVLFDVEHNAFWREDWGPRPDDSDAALAVARRGLKQVPVMVPVYGHRYLPAGRGTSAHPVLSLWQTDIICYGSDLADYIDSEFGKGGVPHEVEVRVEFWRDLL